MAAPTAPILGANGKLYRNTNTYASPTWNEIPNVGDIEPEWKYGEFDVSLRAGGGAKMVEPTLLMVGLKFKMLYDPADADMTALITAATARTAVEFYILDQASSTAGSQGPRATMKCFDMGRKEGIDGIMMIEFDWKLCYSTNTPTWATTT